MSKRTVIAKVTAARTITRDFDKGFFPKTLQLDGVLGANTIPVKLVGIDGNTDTAAYTDAGVALAFSATKTIITIYGPCSIALVKPDTGAEAVGVSLIEMG